MTSLDTSPRVEEATTALSRTEIGVLVAAPLVAFLARILLTPMYQDASDRPDSARLLAEAGSSAVVNDVGAGATLLSAVLFGAAALAIGRLVRASSPRVGMVGQACAATGAVGLAGFGGLAGTFGSAGRADDRAAMIEFFDALYTSSGGSWWIALLVGLVGWVLLGYGMYRSTAVPRAAAVLSALGGAAVMVTTPGPLTAFIAGSAVVCLLGFSWVALAARRR